MVIAAKIGKSLQPALAFMPPLLAGAQVASAQGIQINVTLTTLDAGGLDDGLGDRVVEAYGTLTIGGVLVKWNKHDCEPRFGSGLFDFYPPRHTQRGSHPVDAIGRICS
jgi:hypothetical protein